MRTLKQLIDEINARHTREILDALAGASVQDLQDVLAELRAVGRGSQGPRGSARSDQSSAAARPATVCESGQAAPLKPWPCVGSRRRLLRIVQPRRRPKTMRSPS
jgi:hypothetical protein